MTSCPRHVGRLVRATLPSGKGDGGVGGTSSAVLFSRFVSPHQQVSIYQGCYNQKPNHDDMAHDLIQKVYIHQGHDILRENYQQHGNSLKKLEYSLFLVLVRRVKPGDANLMQ
jgi:hypothetical protein